MVFHADLAYAMELLALVAGTALLVWAGGKEEGCCKPLAKVVGYFTIIVALLTMLCTSYYSFRYWEDGHFRMPHAKQGCCPMMEYHHPKMRGPHDFDCPMQENPTRKSRRRSMQDD